MAPARAGHARLHKRGGSASSVASPTSPLSPTPDGAFNFINRSETPWVTYEEPWTTTATTTTTASPPARPMPTATPSHRKIKPYLRKLSSNKDSNALDLSRPAAENQRLAGLDIVEYDYSGNGLPQSVSDVSFAPVNSARHRHTRSASNTSQFSTTSSLHRPSVTYLPPIRQTPQPYTPPISKSTPASILGSETGADDIMTDEEMRHRQSAFEPSRRSESISSTPGNLPGLRIHTTGSSTRLAGSYSQSTVSLTSPTAHARARGDTLASMDTTTSPSSRTSFDKAFTFMRGSGGRDSPADPSSRAANIRAARQAFQEKEEAKERKHDREVHKQAEREHRKQNKRVEHERRRSDVQDKKLAPTSLGTYSDTRISSEKSSRLSIGGRQYSDHRQAHASTLPNHVPSVKQEKSQATNPGVSRSRQAKGRWARFVAWFKTRLLRMGRVLHVG